MIVSRIYSKEGRILKFLMAEYKSPRAGLYHNPMNCYYTQGFTQNGDVVMAPLESRQSPGYHDQRGELGKEGRQAEKVIVAYWYEVGDYTMYEREDLLKTQWAMRGKSQMAGHVQSPVGDAGR